MEEEDLLRAGVRVRHRHSDSATALALRWCELSEPVDAGAAAPPRPSSFRPYCPSPPSGPPSAPSVGRRAEQCCCRETCPPGPLARARQYVTTNARARHSTLTACFRYLGFLDETAFT